MQEYAARTHQDGLPVRASDYQTATIDPAAIPIRVEKWLVDGRVSYEVAGIGWGDRARLTNCKSASIPRSRTHP